MKIIDNWTTGEVELMYICYGYVFKYRVDDEVYIRTVMTINEDGKEKILCIKLRNGDAVYFENTTKVIPIENAGIILDTEKEIDDDDD